jgi:dipeptidyl aminopeptidase/acylaminoacyl peptidase
LLGCTAVWRCRESDAAEADPLKPPAIETQEVPPVPPAIGEWLQQYQNTRGAGFAGWAPGGKGMLIRTRFGNSLQLHRVYVPGGRREQITFFNEPVDGSFIPKADDGAILLTQSAGGNENTQIYLLDTANYQHTLLTDGKSRNGLGATTRDGKQVIISSNRRNGRDTDLYLADPRKPDSMRLLMQTDKEFWSAVDWSRDEKTLLLVRYVSINESYPALFDIGTKKRTEITLPGKEQGAVGPIAFSHKGDSVFIATDVQGEYRRLARYDLSEQKYEWLTDDLKADVTNLVVDPDRGAVAFAINQDGASRLFLLESNGGGQLARRELKIPLAIVASLEFSPDGKQLGLTLARPDAPADAYSIDLASGEMTRWTYSEAGGLNPATFITPSKIEFASFDGLQVPAWYYKPRHASANKKVPVLITIHGGPESQAQPFFSGTTQFYLNELGIAVIAPNVRGSAGQGKSYLKLDNGALRENSVKDIGALLDWIAKQPELDASRVAVQGASYGGYMVLASLVNYPERIKAGIDVVGIANFNTFLKTTAAYRVDLRRAEYGDEREPATQAFFEKVSPANRADQIRSALMVVHGKNDPRVPFGEAEQIAAKVRALGRPVWTVFAANEGHGFSKKDNADYLRAVEVMFLKEQLGVK